ncbi:hypothetical protein KKF34_18900 [Myxococcota bacterium]|nr:hypothetical protein [Myxococcota bacterium]MBU1498956.1 hypothetical protein [Myxococcota bacterium]
MSCLLTTIFTATVHMAFFAGVVLMMGAFGFKNGKMSERKVMKQVFRNFMGKWKNEKYNKNCNAVFSPAHKVVVPGVRQIVNAIDTAPFRSNALLSNFQEMLQERAPAFLLSCSSIPAFLLSCSGLPEIF